jgi:hypothetical protein
MNKILIVLVQKLFVHPNDPVKSGIIPGTQKLLAGQLQLCFQMSDVPFLQKVVGQHAGQGRRDRNGDPEWNTVILQSIEAPQQRQIGFGNRLEEPVLLEKMLILRVTYEREVSMEN